MADDQAAADRAVERHGLRWRAAILIGPLANSQTRFDLTRETLTTHTFAKARARERKGDHKGASPTARRPLGSSRDLPRCTSFAAMPIISPRSTTRPSRIARAPSYSTRRIASYHERGFAYAKKGDLDRAIAAFTEAVRARPSGASAYENRGLAYQSYRRYDKAVADFTEVIRLDPKRAGRLQIARLCGSGSESSMRQSATTRRRLRPDPSDWRAYFGAGPRAEKGDLDGAIEDFTAVLKRDPDLRRSVRIPRLCLLEERGVRQGGCRLYRGHSARP